MGSADEEGPAGNDDSLTPGLIHEMRHPLMGIKAGLHFLEKELPAATTEGEDWHLVKAQVARLEELFRRYQDFLQPDRVAPAPFSTNDVVQNAVDLIRYQLRRLEEGFTLSLPPTSPIAFGTASVLSHAVTNLLLNSLEALVEKGGRLAVRLARSPDGSKVTVRVTDSGRGLTPEAAAQLFTTGYTTKPANKGSGLGLKLARRLLTSHGGTLDLVPPDDPERLDWAKTEFLLTLPSGETPVAVASPPVQPTPTPASSSREALLVDDEPVILKLLGRTLAGEGYTVTTAATGGEAETLLRSKTFDLLITDKNLPGKSGVALASLARALSPQTVILLITAFGNAESARTLLAVGIDGYLQKPFELDELARRVRAATAVRQPEPVAPPAPAPAPEVVRLPRVLVAERSLEDARRISAAVAGLGLEAVPCPEGSADEATPSAVGIVVATRMINDPLREGLWAARAAHPDFRIVVIMENDSLAECIAAMAIGATGELTRPLPAPEALAEVMRVALQAPRQR